MLLYAFSLWGHLGNIKLNESYFEYENNIFNLAVYISTILL